MNKVIYCFLLLLIPAISYSQVGVVTPASSVVCYGNNGATLTLSGTPLTVLRWEMSYTGSDPWISISNKTTGLTYTNLTTTTWYRAVVQSIGPDVASDPAKVTVMPPAVGGTISGAAMICKGSNEGDLTLSSYVGNIKNWSYSYDGTVWTDTAVVTNKLHYKNNNRTISYKATIESGTGCPTSSSQVFTLQASDPSNAGSISGAATLCEGINSGSVTITGQTGSITRWESSVTGVAPWTTIASTNNVLNYSNLSQTTWYRAAVTSGVCAETLSLPAQITIDKQTVGGTINGSTSVCSKTNTGDLTLTGYTGTINKWQYSTNSGGTWNDTAIVSSTLSYQQLTKTRLYRAEIKNGVCAIQTAIPATITVNPLPIVAFTAVNKPQGDAVPFSNASSIASGSISKYSWDFGDGAFSINSNPTHLYDNYGSYKVKLEATSDKGCVDSINHQVNIYNIPKVDFVFSNICLKEQASFLNTTVTVDPVTSYVWDFGDGTPTSGVKDPTHKYAQPGRYNITLSVTTAHASSSKTIAIDVFPQASPGFVANNVCYGNNTAFLNKSVINGGYLSYQFDFGDGGQSAELNPIHKYTAAGVYNVRLITSTNNNCLDTLFKTIYVHPQPKANFGATNVPFGFPVVFSDSSVFTGTLHYTWSFGDGSSSTTKSPQHQYISSGNFQVELSITTDSSCVDTHSQTVWVYPKPHADFSFKPVCIDDSVSFENLSTISFGTLTYNWTMGSEGTSVKVSPRWKFSSPGTHTIKLIATSNNNGTDTISKTIEIYPKPIAGFTANNPCDGFPVIFTNTSTVSSGSLTGYTWDFGDGTNAIRQSPTRLYLNPGTYTVGLTVASNHNCEAATSKTITVYENPIANFTVANVCFEQAVQTVNLSTGTSASFDWDLGDGSTSNASAPSHLYSSPGARSIKLKVTTGEGCIDSLKRNVIVHALPTVDAGKDTSITLGFPVQLHGVGGSIFTWTPAESLTAPNTNSPLASPKVNTTYRFTVEDENGCINSDSVTVTVEDHFKIIISNVVTPDGNGKNDYWHIENIENYPDADVFVFDRWGKTILHTKNYQNNWQGRNGNNDILPDGTYYYIITIPGSPNLYKGNINVLRNK